MTGFWARSQILRKSTISFIMCVRLSARPHGKTRLPLDGFSWNLIFKYFSKKKYCWKHSYFIKIWQEWPVLYMQTDIHSRYCTWRPIYSFDHISLSSSLNAKWFGRKVLEKTKNTFCAQYIFFSENSGAYEIMWKIIIIIIIIIIMFVNCNWVVTRWQWLFYM